MKTLPRCPFLATIVATVSVLVSSVPVGATDEVVLATPLRLRFVDGDVSFWRPGAVDWAPAQVNTALVAGDDVYTAENGNAEIEIVRQSFARTGADSEVGVESLAPNFVQLKVTSGHLALDLPRLVNGDTVEVDTPNGALIVHHAGYFRIDIDNDGAVFLVRRGGEATLASANSDAPDLTNDQQATVTGSTNPSVSTGAAPPLDPWDKWNLERARPLQDVTIRGVTGAPGTAPSGPTAVTPARAAAPEAGETEPAPVAPASEDFPPAEPQASPSAQYVSADVAGVEDLDQFGTWQDTPEYGHAWVPQDVAPDWAPYSAGQWTFDPTYSWTWVDDRPWGWAPFHYGRWVSLNGTWAWVPGPVVAAPAYSPALVAFLSDGAVDAGGPVIGWVPLGYGEPVIPWWGGPGRIGHAFWGGWGGRHVVNKVVVEAGTQVNAKSITQFQNLNVGNAVVAVDRHHFGQGRPAWVRLAGERAQRLKPLGGDVGVKPTPGSLVARTGHARRPPPQIDTRAVIATRSPQDVATHLRSAGLTPTGTQPPKPRIVSASASSRAREAHTGELPAGATSASVHALASRPMPPPAPGKRTGPGGDGDARPMPPHPPGAAARDALQPGTPRHAAPAVPPSAAQASTRPVDTVPPASHKGQPPNGQRQDPKQFERGQQDALRRQEQQQAAQQRRLQAERVQQDALRRQEQQRAEQWRRQQAERFQQDALRRQQLQQAEQQHRQQAERFQQDALRRQQQQQAEQQRRQLAEREQQEGMHRQQQVQQLELQRRQQAAREEVGRHVQMQQACFQRCRTSHDPSCAMHCR